MSGELTKEQLLEYVKKQKLKIKKLENEISSLKSSEATISQSPSNNTTENKDNSAFQTEIANLMSQLDEKTLEVFRQSKEIKQNQETIAQLLGEKENGIVSISQLNEKLNDCEITCSTLNESIAELSEKNRSVEVKYQSTLYKLQQQSSDIISDTNQLDALTTQISVLENKLSDSVQLLTAREQHISSQSHAAEDLALSVDLLLQEKAEEIAQLKTQLEQQNSGDSDLSNTLQSLSEQNSSLQSTLATLVEEATVSEARRTTDEQNLAAELQRTQVQQQELTTQFNDREVLLVAMTAERDALTIQLQHMESVVSDLNVATDDLKMQLVQLSAASQAVNAELNLSKETVVELERTLSEANKALEESRDMRSAKPETVPIVDTTSPVIPTPVASGTTAGGGGGKKKGKNQKKNGKSASTSSTAPTVVEEDKEEEMSAVSVEDKSVVDNLTSELETVQQQLVALDAAHAQLTAESQSALMDSTAQLETLKKELSHVETESKSQVAALQTQLAEITAQLNDVTVSKDEQHAVYEAQLGEAQAALSDLRKSASESNNALNVAILEKTDIQSQLSSLQMEHGNHLLSEQSETQDRINSLQTQLAQSVADKESSVTALRCELNEVTIKLDAAVESLTSTKALFDSKVQSIQEGERELQTSRQQAEDLSTELLSVRDLLQGVEIRLKEECAVSFRLNAQLVALQTDSEKSSTNDADERKALLEAASASRKECDDLKTELQSVQLKLQLAIDTLTEERDALLVRCNQLVDNASHSQSTLGSEVEQLQARGIEMSVELTQLKTANTQYIDEVSQLTLQLESGRVQWEESKAALTTSEQNIKKLKAHLKGKLKELADVTASLGELQSNAAQSSQSDSVKTTQLTTQITDLRQTTQSLEDQLTSTQSVKTELEIKLKAAVDLQTVNEEKIASLLGERNRLQEEVFNCNYKSEHGAREMKAVTDDRDSLRTRFLELETRLSASERASKESIAALTKQLKMATELGDEQVNECTKLKTLFSAANTEAVKYRDLLPQYAQLQTEIKSLSEANEQLKEQLKREAAESTTKVDALTDKLKKMKQLLNKLNNASHEKDSKMSSLLSLSERPKRFNMVVSIRLPRDLAVSAAVGDEWCFILEDAPPSSDSAPAQSKSRWVEKTTVDSWVTEGSTVIGEWPERLDTRWAAELTALRRQLEGERDDLAERLEDITSQFDKYKVRAQTALKRIGNEERNERQRQQDIVTNNELAKLGAELTETQEREHDLIARLEEVEAIVTARDVSVVELQSVVAQLETALKETKHSLELSEQRATILVTDLANMTQQCADTDTLLTKSNQQLTTIMLLKQSLEQQASAPVTPTPVILVPEIEKVNSRKASALIDDSFASDDTPGSSPVDRVQRPVLKVVASTDSNDLIDASSAVDETIASPNAQQTDTKPIHPLALQGVTKQNSDRNGFEVVSLSIKTPDSVQQTPRNTANGGDQTKSMLYQQTESNMRDALIMLRQENSHLSMEIIELKGDISLRDDQITALKETIREVESSMAREKEFNASNRRINADYLVNVLRKFLMSTNPSERSKLVPVLCIILQFQPDETRVITEKWAVKGGGLVGWFMPPRAPVSSGSQESGTQNEGQKMQRDGTDLSYDPVTGGGIDIHTY